MQQPRTSSSTAGTVAADTVRIATPAPAAAMRAPAAQKPPRVLVIGNLKTPESVLHDPEQDVYFVSNINGLSAEKDNNGFISLLALDGTMRDTTWVVGGRSGVTLHAPKGMALKGDTLWVTDIDALRGFDRRTGAPLATVDLSAENARFLNDIAIGPDGTAYVTDTGIRYDEHGLPTAGPSRVFRIAGGRASVHLQNDTLRQPNGIASDGRGRLIIASFGGREIFAHPHDGGNTTPTVIAIGPGQWDGVVVLDDGRMLVASQATGAIHLFEPDGRTSRKLIENVGGAGDIGWDARRCRVLVPRLGANRVEIFEWMGQ